jgi:hypothetical protein
VGKDGRVVQFFDSKVAPDAPELRQAIEAATSRVTPSGRAKRRPILDLG